MNTNKIATGSTSKRLLAALAVLAVAFVMLAAIPAAAVDSDADDSTSTASSYKDGIVAAYLVSDALAAKELKGDLDVTNGVEGGVNLFLGFHTETGFTNLHVTYTYLKDGVETTESDTIVYGVGQGNWTSAVRLASTGETSNSNLSQDIDKITELTVTIQYDNSATVYTETLVQGNIYLYQDLILSGTDTLTVPAGVTLTGTVTDGKNTVVFDGVQAAAAASSAETAEPVKIALDGTSGITVSGGTISSGTLTVTAGSATVTSVIGADAVVKANYLYTDSSGSDSKLAIVGLTIGDSSGSESTGESGESGTTSANVLSGAKIVLRADQPEPIEISAAADSVLSLSVAATESKNYATTTLTLTSGSLSIDSGALEIGAGASLTVKDNATLAVGSDASLIVNNLQNNGATTLDVKGILTVNGKLALAVKPTYDASTKEYSIDNTGKYLEGNSAVEKIAAVEAAAEQAYPVADISNDNVTALWHDTYAYTGQTFYVVAEPNTGYVITQIGYGTAKDAPNDAQELDVIGNADVAVYPAYSFEVPAVEAGYSVYLTVAAVEGYTATFVAVDAADHESIIGSYVSVPFDGLEVTIPVSTLSIKNYTIGGYYKDQELRNAYAVSSDGSITTSTNNTPNSVTVYVQMVFMPSIEYPPSDKYAELVGGTLVGPSQAVPTSDVTVKVAAKTGYEFVYGSKITATCVYNDGSEQDLTVTDASAKNDNTNYADGATADGGYFTFKMPAYTGVVYTVYVTADFAEQFDVVSKAYDADNPYAVVTITGGTGVVFTGVDTDGNANTSSKTSEKDDASAVSIEGRDIVFTIGVVNAEKVNGVANSGENAVKYGIADVKAVGASGAEYEPKKVSTAEDGTVTYSFGMPAEDVEIIVTYGPVYTLTIQTGASATADGSTTWTYVYGKTTATYSTGELEAEGSVSNSTLAGATDSDDSVAMKAGVTITAAPWTTLNNATGTDAEAHTYVVKSVEIASADGKNTIEPTDNGDGTYTFDMPAWDVTVTVLYADGFTIDKVEVKSLKTVGSVDYEGVLGVAYAAGAKIPFSITVDDGYVLKTVSVYKYADGSTTVAAKDPESSMSFSTTDKSAAVYYDKAAGTVTLTMPEYDIADLVFEFDATVYGNVTVDIVNGNTVVVSTDRDGKDVLTPETDGTYKVEVGSTVYVTIEMNDGSTIQKANATQTIVSGTRSNTVAWNLSSVLSPANGNYVKTIQAITLGSVEASYTITAEVTISELQKAKNTAEDYIERVRASIATDITAGEGTWAEAEASVFDDAIAAVSAASSTSAVDSAIDAFDADILAAVKKTATDNLSVYAGEAAVDGQYIPEASYTAATEKIAAVAENDDDDISDELTAVIEAYDTAMNARTDVQPEPSGAATQVIAGLTGAKQVTIFGVDGYVPAGEISLTLNAIVGGLIVEIQATITIANDAQSNMIQFDIGDDAYPIQAVKSEQQSALSSVYAATFHYESGEVSSTETAIFQIKLAQE